MPADRAPRDRVPGCVQDSKRATASLEWWFRAALFGHECASSQGRSYSSDVTGSIWWLTCVTESLWRVRHEYCTLAEAWLMTIGTGRTSHPPVKERSNGLIGGHLESSANAQRWRKLKGVIPNSTSVPRQTKPHLRVLTQVIQDDRKPVAERSVCGG